MNATEMKTASRQFLDAVWNQGKLDVIEDFVSPNCKLIDPSGPFDYTGPAGYKSYVLDCRRAFPDLQFKIEDQIVEGDKIVTFAKITATHANEFLGVAPSHKKASVSLIAISRFEGEKVVEIFSLWDALTFLRTAGVFGAQAFSGTHA